MRRTARRHADDWWRAPGPHAARAAANRQNLAHLHVGDQRLRVGAANQLAHFIGQAWVIFIESLDERGARQIVALERLVKGRVNRFPEYRIEVINGRRHLGLRGRHGGVLGQRHWRWSSSVGHHPFKDATAQKTASMPEAARSNSLRRNVKPFRQQRPRLGNFAIDGAG